MIQYEKRELDADTIRQMILLSKRWVEEDCSYGMIENQPGDLSEPLFVARDGDRIVGYLFGHFYKQENRTSYIALGSECFCVDEFYVLPDYRRRGIGKILFRMMEKNMHRDCSYITLSTSTKDYKAILNLCVEELGMDFHSAFLIKPVSAQLQEDTV